MSSSLTTHKQTFQVSYWKFLVNRFYPWNEENLLSYRGSSWVLKKFKSHRQSHSGLKLIMMSFVDYKNACSLTSQTCVRRAQRSLALWSHLVILAAIKNHVSWWIDHLVEMYDVLVQVPTWLMTCTWFSRYK